MSFYSFNIIRVGCRWAEIPASRFVRELTICMDIYFFVFKYPRK